MDIMYDKFILYSVEGEYFKFVLFCILFVDIECVGCKGYFFDV